MQLISMIMNRRWLRKAASVPNLILELPRIYLGKGEFLTALDGHVICESDSLLQNLVVNMGVLVNTKI